MYLDLFPAIISPYQSFRSPTNGDDVFKSMTGPRPESSRQSQANIDTIPQVSLINAPTLHRGVNASMTLP